MSHIQNNNLSDQFQSVYCQNSSTESDLLKVKTDILNSLEKGKITCHVLLDLSAAFVEINHDTLLNRLDTRFGIKGTAQNGSRIT